VNCDKVMEILCQCLDDTSHNFAMVCRLYSIHLYPLLLELY